MKARWTGCGSWLPKGVDAALDLAGAGVIPALVELTGDPQRVFSVADLTAPQCGARVIAEPEDAPSVFAEAVRLFEQGGFRIPVSKTYPLERAADAHAESARGHASARLVLTVR